jgi:hypothetical protein
MPQDEHFNVDTYVKYSFDSLIIRTAERKILGILYLRPSADLEPVVAKEYCFIHVLTWSIYTDRG